MTVNALCPVREHRPAGEGCRYLTLASEAMCAQARPGQFVHVRVPGLDAASLRRPFSIFDAADGRVTLLYKIVGRGTEALARVAEGASVEVEGPIGHGFPTDGTGVPLLVGGGFGVAPLHFLARTLIAAGRKPVLFVGGRTSRDLLALDRFAALGVRARVATDDGSVGVKGFAVMPLDEELEALRARGEKFELFTCGPDGLLKAVAMRAVERGMPGWISTDRHMACGVGACFACVQRLRRADGTEWNARCCTDGPVFAAADIVW